MRLPTFNYLAPTSLSEACFLLKEHKGGVAVMAGGTDLLVSMKQRVKTPQYVLGLKGISDLTYIKADGKTLTMGIMTPLIDIENSPVINEQFSLLAEAAKSVASPHLRNMGTLGGNICLDTRCCYYNQSKFFRKSIDVCLKFGGEVCHVVKSGKRCYAISQGDTVPALIALGATVKIQSTEGEQVIPVEELYQDNGKDYMKLKSEELIAEVQIPTPGPHTAGSYKKLRIRKSIDFALVSAAVNLSIKEGICEDIRVVLGSVGSAPIRVIKAEEAMRGKKLTEDVIEEGVELAYKDAKPVSNILDVSPSYRKEMVRVTMRRATKEAISRASYMES
jgi:4-hydroxybenzoyl-CoA reductase subunit beta